MSAQEGRTRHARNDRARHAGLARHQHQPVPYAACAASRPFVERIYLLVSADDAASGVAQDWRRFVAWGLPIPQNWKNWA